VLLLFVNTCVIPNQRLRLLLLLLLPWHQTDERVLRRSV